MKALKALLFVTPLLLLIVFLLFGYRDIPIETLTEKYAPPPSSFINVEGMNVHYRDEGRSSIPVVLIHGTGSSLHTFEEWASQLKKDHRVLRMDLPGYGLTGPFPDQNYSMDHYVEFVRDFLKALEIKKCILGGNSLGGNIAWRFTAEYPEMVEKLILIDASGYPQKAKSVPLAFKVARIPVIKNIFTYITPKSVARSSVKNVYADKSKVSEALVDRYFELTLREGNRQAFIDRLNTPLDTTSYKRIKSIQQSTLIIWGDQDQLIPIEAAYRFHDDLPADTLVILKDTGHVPMEESPDQSLEAVVAFLK
ncbi:alpha/beta fold hydrolase [Fulvivirga sedimenti]|uniref:Alpha/beta hydrolase n=1 Tax=Fulvivirga sedimenti TaxID=2879465 RepID=A0A9X1L1S4_9BACT|nr:alpha/beta hydrolase [Fulvivirga sedimenti]MCA6075036.1 alpha/beta hydrolase [Fulvivirga sedimenti]MCA6076213.1 alpha/beta hydrolase [Fulvivirga sedimenti]MCA6077341.1 alpha/beta hydrolase [Fulvivirga sedimenti]